MTTNNDNEPSVFAKYIAGPENARPSPLENLIKQSRRGADLKPFLLDVLANGPAPANLVIARGIERGFSKRQITYAREISKIISLKGPGKGGGWYWVLPHDNRRIPAQQATPSAPLSLNQYLWGAKRQENKDDKEARIPALRISEPPSG
jgi:hypothetical protein